MNKIRRKNIYSIINRLNALSDSVGKGEDIDLKFILTDIAEDVELIFFEEEDYKDNIPENLQGGYRYSDAEEACDNLESAKDILDYIDEDDSAESVLSAIEEAISCLDDASR